MRGGERAGTVVVVEEVGKSAHWAARKAGREKEAGGGLVAPTTAGQSW
jgi:hypothetical protein